MLYLEHVQVHATVRYSKRGDLKLTLFSPAGTKSVLLPPRPQDFNSNGFHKWPFLTVQQWGEDPRGTWILMVESVTNNPQSTGRSPFLVYPILLQVHSMTGHCCCMERLIRPSRATRSTRRHRSPSWDECTT